MACGHSLYHNEEVVCTSCNYHLPKTNFHIDRDNPVSKLFWGKINIISAASLFYFQKGTKVQHLIHQLKYNKQKEIGIYLGKQYGFELKKSGLFDGADLIIPVPLHWKKLKRRGYNQSELFAEGLSISMNIPILLNMLHRELDTDSQTKRSKYNRWENVKNIFTLRHPEQLKGKHIILADDVVTTGSTLEACASTILDVQDTRISMVTIAFAVN